MKKPVLIIAICFAVINATSQVGINPNNANPAPSAMLDVTSTNKGMLIPRMTSAQRKAINNPDMGLLVFDTDKQTIYLYDGGNWKPMMVTLEHKLPLISRTPAEGHHPMDFGASVDIYGDYAVVGSPYDTAMGTSPGVAYIFAKENGTWVQQARIYASNGTGGDHFGASVSIYGDIVVVGAPQKDISNVNMRGRVYVFKRNNRHWEQIVGLQASNGAAGDQFGYSVSVNGEYIAVGAPYTNHSGKTDAGSMYMFAHSNGIWTQKAILNPSDPVNEGWFGYAVGVSGNNAVAGAPQATVQGTMKVGALYTFLCTDVNGNNWLTGQKLDPHYVQTEMQFGYSLAIENNVLIAGAPYFDYQGVSLTGLTVSYNRVNVQWTENTHGEYTVEGARTGMSVAIDGTNLSYGSPGWQDHRGQVRLAPLVYVYDEDTDATRGFGSRMAIHNGQYIIAAPGTKGAVFFGRRD